MHRTINVHNLLSMDDDQVKELLQEVYFHPTCYMTDSGHGWNTGGKCSLDGTLKENQYNSIVEGKIAMLCHLLKDKGLPLEYYQISPEYDDTPLEVRVQREKEIFRRYKSTHLVLGHSIHADAFPDDITANGTGTFYYMGSRSVIFGEVMQKNLIERTHLADRGVRPKNLKMCRDTAAPWILTEAAFMTNPREKELLKSDGFRNINAIAHVDGLLETVVLHYQKLLS